MVQLGNIELWADGVTDEGTNRDMLGCTLGGAVQAVLGFMLGDVLGDVVGVMLVLV